MALVRNLVIRYIKDSGTIILVVLPSNVDIATQEILTLAAEHDKSGERTLGVLTKPDLVQEKSAKNAVCNLILGKKKILTLGYYVVRNRGADDDDAVGGDSREDLFQQDPWSSLPPDRVGIKALRARLTDLLGQIAQRDFPKLRKDLADMHASTRQQLDLLGPSCQTEREQRAYLSKIATRFQDIVHASLEGHYSVNKEFERDNDLKLITIVSNLCDAFGTEFAEKATIRSFESKSVVAADNGLPEVDYDEDYETCVKKKHEGSKLVQLRAAFMALGGEHESLSLEVFRTPNDAEFSEMEDVLNSNFIVDEPASGISEWVENLYIRSCGLELGTFSATVLPTAFHEQTKKWPAMATKFVSRVIIAIHRFIKSVLLGLCPDRKILDDLWTSIVGTVCMRCKSALDHVNFLADIEREQKSYTLDPSFNKKLQQLRSDRVATLLAPLADTQGDKKQMVDLELIKIAVAEKSNVQQANEEIHDILYSYYEVAQKRFVDNVFRQAVLYFLLTGPESPLAVFSQGWVIDLEAEALESIVGESSLSKLRREALERKVKDLEEAMRILRH